MLKIFSQYSLNVPTRVPILIFFHFHYSFEYVIQTLKLNRTKQTLVLYDILKPKYDLHSYSDLM